MSSASTPGSGGVLGDILVGMCLITTIVEVSALLASRFINSARTVRPNFTLASRILPVDTLYLPTHMGYAGWASVLVLGMAIKGLDIPADSGVTSHIEYGNGGNVQVFNPAHKDLEFDVDDLLNSQRNWCKFVT